MSIYVKPSYITILSHTEPFTILQNNCLIYNTVLSLSLTFVTVFRGISKGCVSKVELERGVLEGTGHIKCLEGNHISIL